MKKVIKQQKILLKPSPRQLVNDRTIATQHSLNNSVNLGQVWNYLHTKNGLMILAFVVAIAALQISSNMNMIHQKANRDTLNKYPEVKKLVALARKEKRFPTHYFPDILEAYDQLGLICGLAYGNYYCIDRKTDHKFEFIAWFFDEQLTVFYMSKELIVNRLPKRD